MEHLKYAASFVGGAAVTVAGLTAVGYLPLWFGPESRAWNREFWDANAVRFLDEMDADPNYVLYRPLESNRNFLQSVPRGPRRVFYFSRSMLKLRGIIYFGAGCEGPPRTTHGGCLAAMIDAALGVTAYRCIRMPCLTAGLTINYREKVPLGSTLIIECLHESTVGRKTVISFKMFSIHDPNRIYVEGTSVFINAIMPANKTMLPPFLALR